MIDYEDPGNVCLDFCFFVLQLWKFVLPKIPLINQISWRHYGDAKEGSGTGAISRRGNVIEADTLHTFDHIQLVKCRGRLRKKAAG